jgi:hypothetical protein
LHGIVRLLSALTFTALILSGCVRTSDGSIEPRYVPELKKVGPVPVVALSRNRTTPDEKFPPRPVSVPPPPLITSNDPVIMPRRSRNVAVPRQRSERGVACRQVPGGERVRWECD